jgi:hypothetical protein
MSSLETLSNSIKRPKFLLDNPGNKIQRKKAAELLGEVSDSTEVIGARISASAGLDNISI